MGNLADSKEEPGCDPPVSMHTVEGRASLKEMELQIFCDSSEAAHEIADYVYFLTISGFRHCSVLSRKARMAPMRTLTI